MRKALERISGPRVPEPDDVVRLRNLFRRNHEQLLSQIRRIPEDHGFSNEYQSNLNKWARCLLSIFIDRNWSWPTLNNHKMSMLLTHNSSRLSSATCT
jgi:hypothetical protein